MTSRRMHDKDMDVDMESQPHAGGGVGKFQLPPLCPVCSALDANENDLLTAFVVEQVKSTSLTSTVLETCNFFATIQNRNLCKNKSVHGTACTAKMTAVDIEQHILYCVATRAPTVSKLVCHNIIMKSVLTAETHAQVLSATKLLLQIQGSDKTASNTG